MNWNKSFFRKLGNSILIIIPVYVLFLYFFYNYSGDVIPDEIYLDYKTGRKVALKEISKNKNVVFIYFEPTCNSCSKLFANINDYTGNFKKILVTSNKNKNLLKTYIIKNQLSDYEDEILIDVDNSFIRDFGLGISYDIPALVFYNDKGQFIKKE
jgi:hypothetical protein